MLSLGQPVYVDGEIKIYAGCILIGKKSGRYFWSPEKGVHRKNPGVLSSLIDENGSPYEGSALDEFNLSGCYIGILDDDLLTEKDRQVLQNRIDDAESKLSNGKLEVRKS